MKKLILLTALCLAAPFVSLAQEEEEDPKKMIREVISVEMEKPKEVKPPPVAVEEPKGKKGKKHHVEEPPPVVEEPIDTTVVQMIPATPAELSKRANAWYNSKAKKYKKDQGASSGNKMTCVLVFDFRPKELNPINDVEGTITMNLTIDFKEGRYRYTLDKMEHKAKRGDSSGGDIYAEIPACGSINLDPSLWKQIKSAALLDGKLAAEELKAKMAVPVVEKGKDDW